MSGVSLKSITFLPKPKRIQWLTGSTIFSRNIEIHLKGDAQSLLFVAERLRQDFHALLGFSPNLRAVSGQEQSKRAILLNLDENRQLHPEGYTLEISQGSAELTASTRQGLLYAAMTLRQLLRQSDGFLPHCYIEDYPDFPHRGVMLDISRDKVPTLQTLFELIDQFSEWKFNELQLYTEHTFAFSGHAEVWAQASPLSAGDVLELDRYCLQRGIELVPNLNSFGHMHRWLDLPQYRSLAECEKGFEWPWGGRSEGPFSINPTDPRAVELMEELYGEFLPNFSSKRFNIGCDETFDLGQGKTAEACKIRGRGFVYLEYLKKLSDLAQQNGRTVQFWGDIVLDHMEIHSDLPSNATILEWGYETGHDFNGHFQTLKKTGLPFYVCPGTASWCSISGRSENCLTNIREAATSGLDAGAEGMLVTDWGDYGHLQYLPVSYLGFVAAAGMSWNYEGHKQDDFVTILNRHVFLDRAEVMGQVAVDLGNAYQHIGKQIKNQTLLFKLINQEPEKALADEVTEKTLSATSRHIRLVLENMPKGLMQRRDHGLIKDEFANAAKMLHFACEFGLAVRRNNLTDPGIRQSLASSLMQILGHHRELWMARNRIGGLQDSPRALEKKLKELLKL